ncbi:Fur family ferric uptake transcriptional regulator [Mariniflexile fucanivorans]|uniref:Fur family ferric uptake transcriptional regulator n=2 Tax=Mariniflexile fucanivorans TaxID=264023 RepID=A0A4R1RNR6_9FLAO|nr:Fur family ferric uptake transcriptional regulator [Mariniflexile fucanivorans]
MHLFEAKDCAITAIDLVDRLDQQMNKTTVYRILDRLENSGVVHSFIGRDGLKWYAKCKGCSSGHHIDAHPHFQCKVCGKVDCLDLKISIPEVKNYKIDSVEIFLTGKCSDCTE